MGGGSQMGQIESNLAMQVSREKRQEVCVDPEAKSEDRANKGTSGSKTL